MSPVPAAEWVPALLTPRQAAEKRLAELTLQRDRFRDRIAGAEAALAAVDPGPGGTKPGPLEDRLHLAVQGHRTASRILAEAEARYRETFADLIECPRCKADREPADFRTVTDRGRTRRFTYCRPCETAIRADHYRRQSPADRRARINADRARHRETRNEARRRYYEANRDRLRDYQNRHAREQTARRREADKADGERPEIE